MYFYTIDDRTEKELVPGIRARTFWGEKMLSAVVVLDPNAILPEHSHPHEQHGLVVAGSLTLTIGGETRVIGPGDLYVIPGGVVHSAVNGPGETRVVDIFAPVREEYKF